MCDLDISLIVRDRGMQKFIQYQSESAEAGVFSPEKALQDLTQNGLLNKNLKVYSNEDYNKLRKPSKTDKDDIQLEKQTQDEDSKTTLLGKRKSSLDGKISEKESSFSSITNKLPVRKDTNSSSLMTTANSAFKLYKQSESEPVFQKKCTPLNINQISNVPKQNYQIPTFGLG